MAEKFKDRVWLTRPRPGIDRLATAWLIRRFIDPRARFRFAEKPEEGGATVPFDMFGVEFSHEGELCTFENLARRLAISSPAVVRVGQMVHDLDLKDGRYGAEEAPAIGRLVEGLRQVYADDHELLEHGIPMFEALYRSFGEQPKSAARPGAGARRGKRRKSA